MTEQIETFLHAPPGWLAEGNNEFWLAYVSYCLSSFFRHFSNVEILLKTKKEEANFYGWFVEFKSNILKFS